MAEDLVPYEIDFVDLYLWPFIHLENNGNAGRRNLMKLRIHGGELASALGQILFQNHCGVLDFIGIVLRIGAQADFALLEPVQDLRLLDRLQAVEIEGSDHRAFHQHEGYHPARLPGLIGRV